MEILQNMEDGGVGPIFFQSPVFQETALYRVHYARRSVPGLTKPEISRL